MNDVRIERRLGWVSADEQRYGSDPCEGWLEAIKEGMCPICGSGPFTVPAVHIAMKHGIRRQDLNRMLNIPKDESICDPIYARSVVERNKQADFNIGSYWLSMSQAEREAATAKIRASHRGKPHTQRQPRPLAKDEPPLEGVRHGGHTAYRKGCRCRTCRDGNRSREKGYRDKAHAALLAGEVDPSVHGTSRGYKYYGCRCDDCLEFMASRWVPRSSPSNDPDLI